MVIRPPNERIRLNKRKFDDEGIEDGSYSNTGIEDIRAKRVISKRSHKLGLNKNLDQNQTFTGGRDNQNSDYLQGKLQYDNANRSIDVSSI